MQDAISLALAAMFFARTGDARSRTDGRFTADQTYRPRLCGGRRRRCGNSVYNAVSVSVQEGRGAVSDAFRPVVCGCCCTLDAMEL